MLNELPQDQAALIVERLGRAKVDELTVNCPDSGTLYRRCVRAMGHSNGGNFSSKIPTKGAGLKISLREPLRKKTASDPLMGRIPMLFPQPCWANMFLKNGITPERLIRSQNISETLET